MSWYASVGWVLLGAAIAVVIFLLMGLAHQPSVKDGERWE